MKIREPIIENPSLFVQKLDTNWIQLSSPQLINLTSLDRLYIVRNTKTGQDLLNIQ